MEVFNINEFYGIPSVSPGPEPIPQPPMKPEVPDWTNGVIASSVVILAISAVVSIVSIRKTMKRRKNEIASNAVWEKEIEDAYLIAPDK